MNDGALQTRTLPVLVDAAIVVDVMLGLNVVRFGTRPWPTFGGTGASAPHLAWIISSVLLGTLVALAFRAIKADGRRSAGPILTRGVVAVLVGSVGLLALNVVVSTLIGRQLTFSVVNLAALAVLAPPLFLAVRFVGTRSVS